MYERVVILMAMPEEAAGVLAAFHGKPCDVGLEPRLHAQSYLLPEFSGVHLVVNGVDPKHAVARVGTTPAALVAYEVVQKLKPQLLLSAGTAGGFAERGVSIGDVYVGERIILHDRYIPINAAYEAYAKGNYVCTTARALAERVGLPLGVVSTCNSFAISEREKALLDAERVVANDMEAAAIAEVAALFDCDMLAVKTITNFVGHTAVAEFDQHFTHALTQLVNALQVLVPLVCCGHRKAG